MCGITGVFYYGDANRFVDREALGHMTGLLAHRGPDGESFWFEGPVAFGHRRLAIVDLSPTGHQPMASASGECLITYNGELYTHQGLRERLLAKGISFRGTSDTESLVNALETWGPGVLSEQSGIFAFGFWDGRVRRLILARDPLGVKQLYFHDDGKRIVFASELKALLAWPDVPRELDPQGLNEYLHFHTPLFERTFFRGIRQVQPGEYLEVTANGISARTYWRVPSFEPKHAPPGQQVEELKGLLSQVVQEQLMADVPVGAFFSGGVDSTAVAAFAQRTGANLRCYGVHFSHQGVVDERPFQESAARALGLDLRLTTLDGSTFPDDLRRLLYFQDQPVIGPAMLPMFAVSRLAAQDVKVCLGGQAADEVFGGYARYALADPLSVLGSLWARPRAAGGSTEGAASTQVRGSLWKQLGSIQNLRRLTSSARHLLDWRERYFQHFSKVSERSWRTLLEPSLISRKVAKAQFLAGLADSPAQSPADQLLHWESRTYLPGLFQQDDRMSMAVSLESRVPLADPRVVTFAFQTPFALKFRSGTSKWILRQAIAETIPEDVLNRRKVGFDTPAEQWIRTRHFNFVRDLLTDRRATQRGWFNARSVERLLTRTNQPDWFDRVWKLLCIEMWARIFMDKELPARELNRGKVADAA